MINKNINSLLCEIDKKVNAMATLTPIVKSESDKIDETGRNTVIGKVLMGFWIYSDFKKDQKISTVLKMDE